MAEPNKNIEIIICRPTPEDIAQCPAISGKVYQYIHEVYEEYMGEELHVEFYGDWKTNKMNGVFSDMTRGMNDGRAFVAKDGDRVVGFCSYHVDSAHHGEVSNNAVDPDYRGHGIAGKLYQACFEGMKAEGIEFACVVTGGDAGHAPARRAYEKAGFQKYLPSVKYFKKL